MNRLQKQIVAGGGFILLAATCILYANIAHSHGPAQWIADGNYSNKAGQLCCGERDCHELAPGDVKETPKGYFITSLQELVPYSEAQPSPDGVYWRCEWGGSRKCFFAPPPNS